VGERDPERLEGQRQRHRVEVAGGQEPISLDRDERAVVDRVQLDLDGRPGGGDLVPQRAVHLRHHAERQRVLDRAREAGLGQLAAGQQAAKVSRGGDLPGQRLGARGLVVERSRVA
jgi:hypothetical protein